MREIHCDQIVAAVRRLCIQANYELGEDVLQALKRAEATEAAPLGREIIGMLLENAEIARREQIPMCQDTGVAVVFAEVGQDLHIAGGSFAAAIQEGVRQGYTDGYLRKSVVTPPLGARQNTGDNTPAVLHTDIVPGDRLRLIVAPKGAGSENMSFLNMLPPSAGRAGVIAFVTESVEKAGANPCPPVIIGVGIGGTVDKVTQLAKRALLRPLGAPHPDAEIAGLERELLERVNRLGIGPQGLGGRTTALAVHVETFPCHIASMPVAVNLQCHAARHAETIL